jgi:DNA-binding transcriptional ArsR family regulator
MERNEELSNVNSFPKIPRPLHERTQKPLEIAGPPRVERRPRRDHDPRNDVGIGVHLRPQEIKALSEVGRFRVVAVRDLAETVYGTDRSALGRDLDYLEKKGIVTLRSVNARRDGSWRQPEQIQVVTLTRSGKKIVHRVGTLSHDQQLYAGLVKPREVEHDTQIYRAYLKEIDRIESLGGSNPRVILDFEIKRNVQRALYAQRKADPDRALNEIKEQVANEFNLPFVDNQIQIQDARIEYDLDQGSRAGSSDIEVVTGAYRPGHLRSKAQAGFRLYAGARDRVRLGRDIEDEHHMLHEILDL